MFLLCFIWFESPDFEQGRKQGYRERPVLLFVVKKGVWKSDNNDNKNKQGVDVDDDVVDHLHLMTSASNLKKSRPAMLNSVQVYV